MLDQWLGIDSQAVLGAAFAPLAMLRGIGRHAVTRYGYTRYIVPCVGMPTLCSGFGRPWIPPCGGFWKPLGSMENAGRAMAIAVCKIASFALVGQVPNCALN